MRIRGLHALLLRRTFYAPLYSTWLEVQKRRTTLRCEAARPTIWPFLDKQDKQSESLPSAILNERKGLP